VPSLPFSAAARGSCWVKRNLSNRLLFRGLVVRFSTLKTICNDLSVVFTWSSSSLSDLPVLVASPSGACNLVGSAWPSASWLRPLLVWDLHLHLIYFMLYSLFSTFLPAVLFLADKTHPAGDMRAITELEEVCVCVCVCLDSNQRSFRLRWCSTDALFTDLCFGFCPLLLSPFPPASYLPLLCSSLPMFIVSHPLMLATPLKLSPPVRLPKLCSFPFTCLKPNFGFCPFDPPPPPPTTLPMPFIFAPPLHHHGNHHLPSRPTPGGLICTFVSPLPLLLLFLSSALRSLSLKMVTPQSIFTLFGMFNLFYSICVSLSVNPILFISSVMSWTSYSSVPFCLFKPLPLAQS